jgi:hypothetical protein
MLIEGNFLLETALSEQIAAVIADNLCREQQTLSQEEISYHPSLVYH